jgi:hypothetical protein
LIANLYGHAQPQAGEKYRLNSISNRLGSWTCISFDPIQWHYS